jgi:hypothetical protein
MATYRCIQSGNTVTFTLPHDIETMKGHNGYILVDEQNVEIAVEPENKELPMTAPIKRMGRPRKIAATI